MASKRMTVRISGGKKKARYITLIISFCQVSEKYPAFPAHSSYPSFHYDETVVEESTNQSNPKLGM